MLSETLTRISINAGTIDKTLIALKNDVQKLKAALVQQMIEKELEENRRLKTEVEIWKSKLLQAENKNGKGQIDLNKPSESIKFISSSQNASTVKTPKNVSATNLTEVCPSKEQPLKSQALKKSQPKQQKLEPSISEKIDVSRLDFRIGRIMNVKKHPDADSLYVEEIDVGEEKPRTVVSGLVKHVSIEEMQNRLVVLLCNLKPAKMRGVLSEAMVMCASSTEKVEILIPPEDSCPGEHIIFAEFPGEPDQQLNPKKKVFEQVAPDLKTDANKVATYKGDPFVVSGKGVVVASTLTDTQIK